MNQVRKSNFCKLKRILEENSDRLECLYVIEEIIGKDSQDLSNFNGKNLADYLEKNYPKKTDEHRSVSFNNKGIFKKHYVAMITRNYGGGGNLISKINISFYIPK
ncbi:MAG: hypothetical protein KJ566_03180 [Nanoarchaeota archaeon]|nr:hypothetical protein [Nanoarchaeota archaeon]